MQTSVRYVHYSCYNKLHYKCRQKFLGSQFHKGKQFTNLLKALNTRFHFTLQENIQKAYTKNILDKIGPVDIYPRTLLAKLAQVVGMYAITKECNSTAQFASV
jgi:hypothetical protein